MLALQISLNGEIKATRGSKICEHLTASVLAKAPTGQPLNQNNVEYSLRCLGFADVGHEVFTWVAAKLEAGDEVTVKLVETGSTSRPIDHHKGD